MTDQMFTYAFLIYAVLGNSFGAEYMERKPDYIKTCQRKLPDTEFVPCSTQSIQGLFRNFVGTGGWDTITSIDPIKLKKIKIFSADGPVSLNTTISEGVVTGFSKAIVIRSYVNPVDYSWVSNIRVPKLRIEGNYDMAGRILVLPLRGHGECWLEPQNMDIKIHTTPKLFEKFGHIFYNITKTRVEFNMTGLKLRLDNLFDGIKLLEDSTNDFLNNNWAEVSEAFKPIIKKTIEENVLEIINKIFNYVPADYLISDIAHPSELYGTSKMEM